MHQPVNGGIHHRCGPGATPFTLILIGMPPCTGRKAATGIRAEVSQVNELPVSLSGGTTPELILFFSTEVNVIIF